MTKNYIHELEKLIPSYTSGQILKLHLERCELSLEELSRKTNIGLNTLTLYATDSLVISHRDSKLIARELGILSKTLRNQ